MKVCAFIALKIKIFNFFLKIISLLRMLKEYLVGTR